MGPQDSSDNKTGPIGSHESESVNLRNTEEQIERERTEELSIKGRPTVAMKYGGWISYQGRLEEKIQEASSKSKNSQRDKSPRQLVDAKPRPP